MARTVGEGKSGGEGVPIPQQQGYFQMAAEELNHGDHMNMLSHKHEQEGNQQHQHEHQGRLLLYTSSIIARITLLLRHVHYHHRG